MYYSNETHTMNDQELLRMANLIEQYLTQSAQATILLSPNQES